MLRRLQVARLILITGIASLILGTTGCREGGVFNPWREPDESFVEHLTRTVDGEGAARLTAETINGSIDVRPALESRCQVRIRKEVRAPSLSEAREFAQMVRIETERRGSEIRVRSEYPDPPRWIQVEISYEIDPPRSADLVARTVNGAITIEQAAVAVDASTVNGGVDVDFASFRRDSQIAVVNGEVDVQVRDGSASLTVSTVNGRIALGLPHDFSGWLDAGTLNGRIRCDIPLYEMQGQPPGHLAGRLGDGGDSRVVLRVVNGGITLRSGEMP
jgi:hypothetical protein